MRTNRSGFTLIEVLVVLVVLGVLSGIAIAKFASAGVAITATADPGPPPSWHAIATHDKTGDTCSITTTGPSVWEISCP